MPQWSFRSLRVLCCVLLSAAAACGGDVSGRGTASSAGVTVSGQSAHLLLPSTEASKAFDSFTIAFASYGAVAGAGGNAMATLSRPTALPGTTASCASSGCDFQVKNVTLAGTNDGVFALLAPSSAASTALYVPSATLVFNANQLIIANKSRGAQSAQGQALAVSQDGLTQLGKLTGVAASDLLARGVCIGLVATTRGFAAGEVPGQGGALVTLRQAPEGAALVYPDDAFLNVGRQGTNAKGAFIVTGGTTPPADGAGTAVAVDITASNTGLIYSHQHVILRPGMITVMPMLPTL